ncbi:cathepsin k [Anaeramoeba flamelloides]|uniref:Cathepsin k n=1 Tax=Anaeramoeba flamelloides TaxID=1746091 RepID=A0AAV7YBI2_9EUKA|nr:cathepsin k [Anaeramoeba flamelloides]|eukprot:Anaeramoba_flamelloidesa333837_66.p1 GENE.a333837_66~~a333837_66.p1  ORF type:complete len:305 (-),score=65.92 a333837_66:122-1036(-)
MLFFISFLLASSLFLSCSTNETEKQEFDNFLLKYDKNYSPDEYQSHFKIFQQKRQQMLSHNSKEGVSFQMGINEFSDLSFEEISSQQRNLKKIGSAQNSNQCDGSVELEGECSGSIFYAMTDALSSCVCFNNAMFVKLSIQQLIDCASQFGCNGAEPEELVKYMKTYGLCSDDDYPFVGEAGYCKSGKCKVQAKFENYHLIRGGDEVALLKAVQQYGSAFVLFDASSVAFQSYTHGIYDQQCQNLELNHAMQLTGYGTQNGNPYWICKNTWGTGWGMEGYVWVYRGLNICGIANEAYYFEGCSV